MTTTDNRQPRSTVAHSTWTSEELDQIRASLQADLDRLSQQVSLAERDFGPQIGEFVNDLGDEVIDISTLMVELNEGSSMATNDRDILAQTQRALQRLDSATYGSCETCAQPIPKERLMALPRATHCMPCQTEH